MRSKEEEVRIPVKHWSIVAGLASLVATGAVATYQIKALTDQVASLTAQIQHVPVRLSVLEASQVRDREEKEALLRVLQDHEMRLRQCEVRRRL